MRIDRLTVKNFKGFEEREFHFHPNFNLIVGKNGTGKTTLLDALSVAAGAWLVGVANSEYRRIRAEEVRLKPVGEEHAAKTLSWEPQYPCVVEASGEIGSQPLVWARMRTGRGARTFGSIRELVYNAHSSVRRGEAGVVLPVLSYYGTGRLCGSPAKNRNGMPKSFKAKQSRLAGYLDSLNPKLSTSELSEFFARQSWIAYQTNDGFSTEYEGVRDAIMACLHGARDLYFDPARGEIVLEIKGQGKQPFGNLSDGQRNLLAMVGDLARKIVTLNPEFGKRALKETPGVVLIDELDLHLHPEWQRQVIEDLRTVFPKVQFFASTHSPFLIQSLRSGEELLMLEGQPTAQLGNKSPTEIAAAIMGVEHPEVSERYLEMKETAKSYLETLEAAAKSPKAKLSAYKRQLAKATTSFADNPAYQAFLEMKRTSTLGE